MSRRIVLLIGLAVLASGCGPEGLGRTVPSCDPDQATSTLILQAQTIPGLEYVPCVNDLKAGWEYEHLQARSGLARFWLSSDRVGERFLEVTLRPGCDLGEAVQVPSDEGDVPLFVDVERSDSVLSLVVIPEGVGAENRSYALQLAEDLAGESIANRVMRVVVDAAEGSTQDRIARAVDLGSPALVVGSREQEEGLVELHLAGRRGAPPQPRRLPLEDAIEEIEDALEEPAYRATWHYLFEGGCATYEIDARGPGVATIEEDVQAALGLYLLEPLREFGEQYGWVLP